MFGKTRNSQFHMATADVACMNVERENRTHGSSNRGCMLVRQVVTIVGVGSAL